METKHVQTVLSPLETASKRRERVCVRERERTTSITYNLKP